MTGTFWWRERIFRDFGHSYFVELVFEERDLQKIQIFKNSSWGYFLVLDGIVQFTERDEYIYHETITLLPLSLLPQIPERVLIIGGGDGGVLRELQKFPQIKEFVQYEVDKLVFELSQKYFFKISGDYGDSRVNFIIKDGYLGLKESPENYYDLIIVDCTDPVGPAKTLYTREFYEAVNKALTPSGIFIQQASLPIYFPHILQSAYKNAKEVFPLLKVARVFVPSYGEEIAFLVGSLEEKNWMTPLRNLKGKFYHPGLNPYYFSLPGTWINIIES